MSKKIFVYNESLLKEDQRIADPIVDVYDLVDDKLVSFGWLYNNLWPTSKFELIIEKIRAINPIVISDNPRFWDNGIYGYSVYNHAIDMLTQSEGLEY